ncbi:aspartate aminotransferase family protein [Alphaproteobacteria bacterium]|nr:aspartate aminotransferase family protein [Alphaproteobacteria bacterium]
MASSNGFSHVPEKVEKISTKNRKIITKIPVPESISILNKMYSLESRSMHGQLPLVWDKAQNYNVYDKWGNKWIDFTSTIFVANAGHGNKGIIKKVRDSLSKPLLHTYNYANQVRVDYLDYLIKNTPKNFEKAYLISAGTESTEAVMKFMRLHGINKKKGRGIITLSGSYHGRTLGAEMAGGSINYETWVSANDKDLFKIDYPDFNSIKENNGREYFYSQIENLEKQNKDFIKQLSGILLETYQGWSARFLPITYVKAAYEFCKANDVLIAFDEMQAGFGRTGPLFGYMHYDITPDLICCGKGASSGFALSLVLGKTEIMDLPKVGTMSSTNSANPISCAAGLANFQEINNKNLLYKSKILGNYFHTKLNRLKKKYSNVIKFVEGKGMVASLIFMDNYNNNLASLCDKIAFRCFQRGLLVVHTGRESIKLAPPLTITKTALNEGISVIDEVLFKILKES